MDQSSNCADVAHLAYHILTRNPRISFHDGPSARGKLLVRMQSCNIQVDIDHDFSTDFFDFLDACLDGGSCLQSVLKVSKPHVNIQCLLVQHQHRLLWASNQKNLRLLLPYAERTALRVCNRVTDLSSDVQVKYHES